MVPVSLVLRRSSCALEFPYILVRHRPDATPAVSGLQLSPLSNRHQHLLLQHDSGASCRGRLECRLADVDAIAQMTAVAMMFAHRKLPYSLIQLPSCSRPNGPFFQSAGKVIAEALDPIRCSQSSRLEIVCAISRFGKRTVEPVDISFAPVPRRQECRITGHPGGG